MKLVSLVKQGGAAMVEFALVIPIFFLLIFGIIDVGIGVWSYNNLAEAVREGGRYAMVRGEDTLLPSGEAGPLTEGPVSCDGVGTEIVVPVVCQFAFAMDPSRLDVTVTWAEGNNIGDPVVVSAVYAFAPFSNFIPFTVNLQSETRARVACCR